MAYPFRKMTTRELKKLSRDDRNGECNEKPGSDSRIKRDLKIKSQEDVCKN